MRFFFVGVIVYHPLTTRLRFGLDIGVASWVFPLVREGVWLVILFASLCIARFLGKKSTIGGFFAEWKWVIGCIVGFFVYEGVAFLLLEPSWGMMTAIVGRKSLIYPGIVYVGGVMIGKLFPGSFSSSSLLTFALFVCLVTIIGGGTKVLVPDFFIEQGYGPVGDWNPDSPPPVYYRTGPGGLPRLSGFFAGPNNMGYVLIFWMPLLLSFPFSRLTKWMIAVGGGVMGLASMARSVVVGRGVHIFRLWTSLSRQQRFFAIVCGVVVGSVGLWISFWGWKQGSSIERLDRWAESFALFLQSPWWGYGLGASGPGFFYGGMGIPESTYLQVLLDGGVIGAGFWLAMRLMLCVTTRRLGRIGRAWVWSFVGLMVAGLFLHVFEDTSVVLLIFALSGWAVGSMAEREF